VFAKARIDIGKKKWLCDLSAAQAVVTV